MRLPYRSQRNTVTPTLPSILTLFPANYEQQSNETRPEDWVKEPVGGGLELAPIERSNTSCAKTVSPSTEEKEVSPATYTAQKIQAKPLPPLPKAAWRLYARRKWCRWSVRKRVLVVFGVHLGLLLIIGLSLLSLNPNVNKRGVDEENTGPVTTSSFPDGPLPEGMFNLNLGYPREQSSACLSVSDEASAWACPTQTQSRITISSNQLLLSTESAINTTRRSYEQQPFPIRWIELNQIYEPDPSDSNHKYHFRTLYDRSVLLSESQSSFLDTSQHAVKHEKRQNAAADDERWLCFFNNTILEAVVYTSQHATTAGNMTNTTTTTKSPFPYVIHISEKWTPNGTRAYCEHQSGSSTSRLRNNNMPKYFLSTTETSDTLETPIEANNLVGTVKRQEKLLNNACECQWTVQ